MCSCESLSDGTRVALSLPPWRDERAENRAGEQELQVCREVSGAVPAAAAVEELATARAQEGEDVLEVGGGARRGTERRRIERAAARGDATLVGERLEDIGAAADPLRTASRTMGGQLNSRARQHKKERWAELANEAFVLLRGG